MTGHRFTPEQNDFIRNNYSSVARCVELFNAHFGTDMSKLLPKHKKRKSKSSPKKADHKHKYYSVIIKLNYNGTDVYYLGYKCKLCGNISNDMKFFDDDGIINKERIKNKYNHLDIVEM